MSESKTGYICLICDRSAYYHQSNVPPQTAVYPTMVAVVVRSKNRGRLGWDILRVLMLDFFSFLVGFGLLSILGLKEALTPSEDYKPKVCYQMIIDF